MKFAIIDPQTGEYPWVSNIVEHEEWAKHLDPLQEGWFVLCQDGDLALIDDIGHWAYPPEDRFEVRFIGECKWL